MAGSAYYTASLSLSCLRRAARGARIRNGMRGYHHQHSSSSSSSSSTPRFHYFAPMEGLSVGAIPRPLQRDNAAWQLSVERCIIPISHSAVCTRVFAHKPYICAASAALAFINLVCRPLTRARIVHRPVAAPRGNRQSGAHALQLLDNSARTYIGIHASRNAGNARLYSEGARVFVMRARRCARA